MPAPLGLDLRIETPENVVLTYRLAGPGLRAPAYLIDFTLRAMIILFACFVTCSLALVLPGLALGSLLLLMFVIEWGYTIGFEYAWQGRTPGKWLLGLRVIQENGQSLSWWGSALRNLLRVADTLPLTLLFADDLGAFCLLPVYGPGLFVMLCSPKLQRLGDLAARTVVIQERRGELPREPVIVEKIEPLPRGELNSFSPGTRTLSLIDRFLGRWAALMKSVKSKGQTPDEWYDRGHVLASPLAKMMAWRLNYASAPDFVRNYPMAFLARAYVTFAARRDSEEDLEDEPKPKRPAKRRRRRPEARR